MPKVLHYNIIYFLRYPPPRYMQCLFTNIQKQQNMLKSSLLFKKNTNFTGKYLGNSQVYECEIFRVLFSYGAEHILKFSNLHQCTFNFTCFVNFLTIGYRITLSIKPVIYTRERKFYLQLRYMLFISFLHLFHIFQEHLLLCFLTLFCLLTYFALNFRFTFH